MKIKGEFIPLALLIPSLENNQRLYFLYRQAAESGSRGAQLRFRWFRKSLADEERQRLERLFEPAPARKRFA